MQEGEVKIQQIVKGKRVLFVTHKTAGYIRNSQELRILRKFANSVVTITADAKLTWTKYFSSIVKILFKLLFIKRKKYDVIFLGYLPQFIVPIIYPLFKNKILIIDFYISLYDTLIFDKKLLSKRNPLAKIVKWIDIRTVAKANYYVVDTKAHEEYFKNIIKTKSEKTIVLYIEADRTIYFPHKIQRPL